MDTNPRDRNYSSISPSARSLLLMKGYTGIPFARQAAELMMYPEPFIPDATNKDFTFWARVMHFENRYWSIDQLLSGLPVHNVLELSSGFSFRGLEMVNKENIHYIDTDLPDIIDKKKKIVSELQNGNNGKGQLEILPLNALDEKQFNDIADHFSKDPLIIVNEGLLMYLGNEEKEKLCAIIHKILQQRGGYWITADIYIKGKEINRMLKFSDKLQEFFEQHNIEENKFDSLETAKDFFTKNGFILDKEAVHDHSKLSSLDHFLQQANPDQLSGLRDRGKIHATWRLKAR